MHGIINVGNAGTNERMHKEDKAYYARTNRTISNITRQHVVQLQGARIIQRRNAGGDESLAAGLEESPSEDGSDSDGAGCVDDEDGLFRTGGGGRRIYGADRPEADPASAVPPPRVGADNAIA